MDNLAVEQLADSADVVRLRLVRQEVTLVHRCVWPALARVADQLRPTRRGDPVRARCVAAAAWVSAADLTRGRCWSHGMNSASGKFCKVSMTMSARVAQLGSADDT